MIEFEYKRMIAYDYFNKYLKTSSSGSSNQPHWEEDTLNYLGKQGWELIQRVREGTTDYLVYFMKRAKSDQRK